MKYKGYFFIFVLLLILNACKHPESFEYREIKDLQVKHIGLTQTKVAFNVLFYNPNNFNINLKKIDCAVFFNQKYLVDYKLDTMMHIASKTTFAIPATLNFDLLDVMKRGFSTIMNKEALVSVKGNVRVGKACFYKNIPVQYEIKYKLPF